MVISLVIAFPLAMAKILYVPGFTVILVHDAGNIGDCIEECVEKAAQMAAENPKVFVPQQFESRFGGKIN